MQLTESKLLFTALWHTDVGSKLPAVSDAEPPEDEMFIAMHGCTDCFLECALRDVAGVLVV